MFFSLKKNLYFTSEFLSHMYHFQEKPYDNNKYSQIVEYQFNIL